MIRALDDLVETRIREAQRDGRFDDLPGQGSPLDLDDEPLVPEDVRIAHRVLRNAGLVPPAVATLRDAGAGIVADIDDDGDAGDALDRRVGRRLLAISVALERRGISLPVQTLAAYRRALYARLSGGPDQPAGPGRAG